MPNQNPLLFVIDYFKSMNRVLKKNLIPKDTAYYAGNVRFDVNYGTLAKRVTRSKYNSTTLGAEPISALHRYYKNSNNSVALIGAYSGLLKVGYDETGVFSNIKTGLTSNNWVFQTYKDLAYMFNGQDDNLVFSLINKTGAVTTMGIPSAIIPSGTISLTAGLLLGSVNYAVSYQFDGYQEGNASPSSALVNVNVSRCKVTIPTLIHTRCTGRYIYRTKSNASTLYRLATVADNTSTSYMDNIADTSLDLTITAPIDYGIPSAYRYCCLHKERLFLAWNINNKSRIIYSDLRSSTSYPDVFRANARLDIAKDDGDEITSLLNDPFGQLIVFKKNSVRVIQTTADSDITWTISDSYSHQGCIAPYSAVTTPIGIIYLTRYGERKNRLVRWTGNAIVTIPELEGIEPLLTDIPETSMNEVKGHYHNGFYYLSFRNDGLYNDKVLCIDVSTWSCSVDDKNVECFCSWNGGEDFGELYTGSSDNSGFVYREDADNFDLLIRKKTEIDQGTHSNTASSGGETTPSLGLSASLASNFAGRRWMDMISATDTWADFTGANDTWWYTGEWLDTVREISAKALSAILWNETKTATTDVVMFVRTGDTSAACEAASWSEGFRNQAGSLTNVAAGKYIQILAKLSCQNLSDYNKVFIYRNGTADTDYAIKISANFGSPAEATIEFDWQSGRIDLGDINEAYKRLRKRIRSVRIEYERDDPSTGSLVFYWYANGSSTPTGNFSAIFSENPRNKIYNFPLNNFVEDFSYRLYSNTDTKSLKIKRIIFTVSVEPLYVKI